MKKTLMAALLLLLPMAVMAQMTKKSFSLEDLMWGGNNYYNIMPRGIQTAWWGDCLVQPGVEDVRLLTDAKGRKVTSSVLFTEEEVNAALDSTTQGRVHGVQYVSFPSGDRTEVMMTSTRVRFLYDWKQHRVIWAVPRITGVQHSDMSAASRATAYVKNWNLYVQTADGATQQVTTDGNRELQYGMSVHRDEFGINKGTFWSPKGTLLAYYRMDQTMVTDFPLVDINHRVAQLAPEKYPMAGMAMHKVTVHVYNPATGRSVQLDAGDPTDRYFTNIAWSPDERTVYVIELPRTQDRAELVAYDAETGSRRGILFTEKNDRYVEPMNPIVFLPWDDNKFVYQSRRDGYNHFYLYNKEGKLLKQLTHGNFEVINHLGFDVKRHSIIYSANSEERPTAHTLYAVSVDNARVTPLGIRAGVHHGTLSATGRYVNDIYTTPDEYRTIDMVNTANGVATRIFTYDRPWQEYNVPEITSGSIKAADGRTDLYYRLVKPVGFDPAKKYPTVVYVYGGPHAHNVDDSWNYAARPWEIYMAQRGYVIFVVDNRGSQYRGFEFESCTHRRLGQVEMADQMKGVEFLKSLPYVDASRLGVHGWSFGGFMTTNLMLSYPETFKVGVAGGPVIDWKLYEVMYGERYMDTPQENPDGYKAANLLEKAGNLKGRLQIIVGYNDPTCVMQHSLGFLRACEDAGTQPDYFVYPGDGHNMMGHDMVHLHERITRYFDDYLK